MVTLKRRESGRNKGIATVEAAFVFSVLLLLTFGVIHYGWLFMRANQIANAAREGARIAIRPDATDADVYNAIDRVFSNAGISGYDELEITSGFAVATPGTPITVKLKVSTGRSEIGLLVNLHSPLELPTPEYLKASVTMAKEGPPPSP